LGIGKGEAIIALATPLPSATSSPTSALRAAAL